MPILTGEMAQTPGGVTWLFSTEGNRCRGRIAIKDASSLLGIIMFPYISVIR